MSEQPQNTTPENGTRTQEVDEPNEFGFSGGATAPQPEPERERAEDNYGESIAVPAGDLTGAITAAIDEISGEDDEDERKKS
jgi:hypothetical protein